MGRAAAGLAAAAIAWSYVAFGAVYWWAAPPLLVLTLLAMAVARAWPAPRRLADAAGLAALAVVALQLVPLPAAALDAIAPDARAFRAAMLLGTTEGAWLPLSLDPARTRTSLMLAGAAFALFLAARASAAMHGRALARWIAWMGIAAAALGLGQSMLFRDGFVYGFWRPIEPGAAPFGAIINRNHFAAWAIGAASLAAGALMAQAARRSAQTAPRRRLAAALADARAPWLLFSIALLIATVVLTASRAGFAGLVAASVAAMLATRRRVRGAALLLPAVVAVACAAAALSWARPDRLLSRLDNQGHALGARAEIWKASASIAGRYPVAGVGLGAFPAAMTHYQPTREVFFNHAHNQYLELLSEGGVLLVLPLAAFALGVGREARRGLARDQGSFFWLRAGATAALAGLAVLAIWESPFRTPAVLMIAAAAAGIAASDEQR